MSTLRASLTSGSAFLPKSLLMDSALNPTGPLHYIWDASVLSTLGTVQGTKNDGNQINSWQIDPLGNINNTYQPGIGVVAPFTQGTAANCPLLRLSGINGNAYAEFNGVNHRLSALFNSSYAREFNYSTQNYEWFVVCKFRTAAGGIIVGNYRNVGGAEFFYMLRTGTAGVAPDNPASIRLAVAADNYSNWSDNVFNSSANTLVTNQMSMCSYQLTTGAKLRTRINGVLYANTVSAAVNNQLPNSSVIYLGTTDSGGIPAAMDLYYMGIASGELSAVNREVLTRYLSHRFSIPLATTGAIT